MSAVPTLPQPFEQGDTVYYDDSTYREVNWTVSTVEWRSANLGESAGWWLEIDPDDPEQAKRLSVVSVRFVWTGRNDSHTRWKRRPDPVPEFPSTRAADSWLDRHAP